MNVMITGAAGGLGRALANECGRRGYNLFLTSFLTQSSNLENPSASLLNFNSFPYSNPLKLNARA
jgi:short-subunit dehydrogenase